MHVALFISICIHITLVFQRFVSQTGGPRVGFASGTIFVELATINPCKHRRMFQTVHPYFPGFSALELHGWSF